jgi:hypothetical protein
VIDQTADLIRQLVIPGETAEDQSHSEQVRDNKEPDDPPLLAGLEPQLVQYGVEEIRIRGRDRETHDGYADGKQLTAPKLALAIATDGERGE